MSKAPVRRSQGRGVGSAELGRELPKVRPVGMSGDFPSRVSVAPGSTTSLILVSAIEEGTDRPVLVPFVDLKIAGVLQSEMPDGAEEQDFGTLLASTLPLENAIFLYFDMVRDLGISLSQLVDATGGRIGLEVQRLKLAHLFSEQLAQQAADLRDIVGALVDASDQSSEDDRESQPFPPEPKVASSSGTAPQPRMRLRKGPTPK